MRSMHKLFVKTTKEINKLEPDKQELITTRYKAKLAYADLLAKQIIASL